MNENIKDKNRFECNDYLINNYIIYDNNNLLNNSIIAIGSVIKLINDLNSCLTFTKIYIFFFFFSFSLSSASTKSVSNVANAQNV